jgi:hypothetical protein
VNARQQKKNKTHTIFFLSIYQSKKKPKRSKNMVGHGSSGHSGVGHVGGSSVSSGTSAPVKPLTPEELAEKKKKSNTIVAIFGWVALGIGCLVVVMLIGGFIYNRMKKRNGIQSDNTNSIPRSTTSSIISRFNGNKEHLSERFGGLSIPNSTKSMTPSTTSSISSRFSAKKKQMSERFSGLSNKMKRKGK